METITANGNLLGWAAATLTLLTFNCTNMQRLRLLALSANGAFLAYALMAGLTPVLALHLTLIPVNLYRLMQARERLRAEVAPALTAPAKSEPLGAVRQTQRLVTQCRVARPQMGACASSLRKSLKSRPRGPAWAGNAGGTSRVCAPATTTASPVADRPCSATPTKTPRPPRSPRGAVLHRVASTPGALDDPRPLRRRPAAADALQLRPARQPR